MSSAMDYTRFEPPTNEEPWDHEFTVEVQTGIKENNGWDLLCEGVDWNEAKRDAEFMKNKNYRVRIFDERGIEWEL